MAINREDAADVKRELGSDVAKSVVSASIDNKKRKIASRIGSIDADEARLERKYGKSFVRASYKRK